MLPAQAQSHRALTVYIQTSHARHHTEAATAGITRPFKNWQHDIGGGTLTGYWDFYASRWSFDTPQGERVHSTLVGATPTWRWRPNSGQSPWFVEAGIGIALADHPYVAEHRAFSTRANFASHVGLGIHLGAQQQHEWTLRIQHLSNAGVKKPNPGENFVQLRYALHF